MARVLWANHTAKWSKSNAIPDTLDTQLKITHTLSSFTFLDQFLISICPFRCSRHHPRPNSSVTLMIPGMYNDIRLSQSMLDEADQDTSLEVRSAPGKYAWHIHSLLSCFHADMGKMMWCSHRFCVIDRNIRSRVTGKNFLQQILNCSMQSGQSPPQSVN